MAVNAKRENRIKGIVDRASNEDHYDDVAWITQAPVQVFCRSAVDETAQANAELHNDLGLQAKIRRQTVGENCKWCDNLAGEYDYPGVPQEVFQRHDDCDCIVEYLPGDGRAQDVWIKEWKEDPADLEARKNTNLADTQPVLSGKKLESVIEDSENVEELRQKFKERWQESYDKFAPWENSEQAYKQLDYAYAPFQKGMANEDNFFWNTIGTFEETKRPKRKPDFVSKNRDGKISSEYWYTENGVIRGSDHWGMSVASCDWPLKTKSGILYGGDDLRVNKAKKSYGKIRWNDFKQKTKFLEIEDKGLFFETNFNNTIGKEEFILQGKKYYKSSKAVWPVG